MECWTLGFSPPALIGQQAAAAEAAGWDGLLVPDNQSLIGDPFVALAVAATTTSTLKLGTGVTNPVTRNPAIVASAIAGIHAVTGGRAVLGIGRGDSSLAHLGLAPASLDTFRTFLARLQTYLSGQAVDFSVDPAQGHRSIKEVPLAGHPEDSRILWLDPELPKVPVDVAATGPKVIAIGAVIADRMTFAVGADVERLSWAMKTARDAREQAGLDPDTLTFGAYVNVVAHPDQEVASSLVSAGVATLSRFSMLHGKAAGPLSEVAKAELEKLTLSYDMNTHGSGAAKHREAVSREFVNTFGIAGPPEVCISRLRDLEAIGISRVVLLSAFGDGTEQSNRDVAASRTLFENEVIPRLRDSTPAHV
jgi:5,10-methylenetetrahydromethanopterin reductase